MQQVAYGLGLVLPALLLAGMGAGVAEGGAEGGLDGLEETCPERTGPARVLTEEAPSCPAVFLRGPGQAVEPGVPVAVEIVVIPARPALVRFSAREEGGAILMDEQIRAPGIVNVSAPPAGQMRRLSASDADPACARSAPHTLLLVGRPKQTIPETPVLDVRGPRLAAGGDVLAVTLEMGRGSLGAGRVRLGLEQGRPVEALGELEAPRPRINLTFPIRIPCLPPGRYDVVATGLGRQARQAVVLRAGNCPDDTMRSAAGAKSARPPAESVPGVGLARQNRTAKTSPLIVRPVPRTVQAGQAPPQPAHTPAPSVSGRAVSSTPRLPVEAKYLYYLGAFVGGVAGLLLATQVWPWRKPRSPPT